MSRDAPHPEFGYFTLDRPSCQFSYYFVLKTELLYRCNLSDLIGLAAMVYTRNGDH